jgi:4-amino-4-deoxychorismate lyase
VEIPLCPGADAPGLTLIETMGWDGQAIAHLALHLARLERGAGSLGWRYRAEPVEAALATACPPAAARLRLTLDRAGHVAVEVGPPPAPREVWRLGLARQRLASDDPWLRLKTSRRAAYDAARAALPDALDEVIFRNERDEVCDGSITTLFFDRGQGMRTPPLSSGLLPGVLRAALDVPEEVLMVRDLPRVRLWVGNALRGLAPAVWAES